MNALEPQRFSLAKITHLDHLSDKALMKNESQAALFGKYPEKIPNMKEVYPTCRPAALAYNAQRGVRNHVSGPPLPIVSGIFLPADHAMVGRGVNIPNSARRTYAVLNSRPPLTGHRFHFRNRKEASHGQQ